VYISFNNIFSDEMEFETMNWTVIGLCLDVVGFLLVFWFGGFEVGSSPMSFEDDTSDKWKPVRIIGMVCVILGFAFQIVGSL